MPSSDYFLTCSNPSVYDQKISGSRFSGYLFTVNSVHEVEIHLNGLRKKFYDATHHCFAWRIRNSQTGNCDSRFNDDGEPSGTAGKPILQVLESEQLENVLIVVVRYFGGTKLGTGGLVKAYGSTARETVNQSGIIKQFLFQIGSVRFNYDFVSAFINLCQKYEVLPGIPVYGDQVDYSVQVLPSKVTEFSLALTELSNGKVSVDWEKHS